MQEPAHSRAGALAGSAALADDEAAEKEKTPQKPPVDLNAYVGSYYSPELETTYTIELRDGKLVACHQRHPDVVLRPLSADKFIASAFYFPNAQFERDDEGHVRGLRLNGMRVRNLVFQREPDGQHGTQSPQGHPSGDR